MPKQVDLTGERFGRLLLLEKTIQKSRASYMCRCDCGTMKTIQGAYIVHGGVRSCGCLRAESSARIAQSRRDENAQTHHPLYKRWMSMKQRCSNPANPFFKNYGARGIAVCDKWLASFSDFVADVGMPPTAQHTLERINNDLGYSPDNVRWALRSEQLRNQRRSIILTCNDITQHAKEWAAVTGISYQRITRAFRVGGVEAATALVQTHLNLANPASAA